MKSISFDNKIIIYWLYDEYVRNANYKFYLDDNYIGESDKTHYTFENLNSNQEYHIQVYCNDNLYFDEHITTKKTLKKINLLDVCPNIVNDGSTLVTKELQKAIDLIDKDSELIIPKGTYLSGALFIHSDSTIYFEEDAMIKGSTDFHDYLPKIPSRFEGIENMSYASLINIGKMNHNEGYTTKNVVLYGKGTIFGGGHDLCYGIIDEELMKEKGLTRNSPDYKWQDFVEAGRYRNRLINISNAENVLLEGLSLGYSASWNVHFIYSRNVITTNCSFHSTDLHNGDGWDPDSSNNCTLFNCVMDVGDDAIAVKSGKNPEGNIINIPSYDINVFDIISKNSHGCAIGSEMSGGIYNVNFYDCDFTTSYFGLHVKATKKRGAYIKNINFENFKAPIICVENVTYNDDGEAASEIPQFSNLNFNNVTLSGHYKNPAGEENYCPYIKIIGYEDYPSYFNNIKITNIKKIPNILKENEQIVVKFAENVTIE